MPDHYGIRRGGCQGSKECMKGEPVVEKEYEDLILTAVQAALLAGAEIMRVYSQADFNVDMKSDDSPLTDADRKAHDVISSRLEETGIPVLSEEGRDIPFGERSAWERLWIVDPLDGTKEFIKRNGEFTVNIALIKNRRPVFGVVYAPDLKRLFFGGMGWGSYTCLKDMNDLPEKINEMVESSEKLPNKQGRTAYVVIGSRSHSTPELEAFVAQKRTEFDEVTFISAGSSLKFCRVAEGVADIYPRTGPTMEWDTAAGQAVAEGAGRKVTVWETGEVLGYNRENLLNPWFVVA